MTVLKQNPSSFTFSSINYSSSWPTLSLTQGNNLQWNRIACFIDFFIKFEKSSCRVSTRRKDKNNGASLIRIFPKISHAYIGRLQISLTNSFENIVCHARSNFLGFYYPLYDKSFEEIQFFIPLIWQFWFWTISICLPSFEIFGERFYKASEFCEISFEIICKFPTGFTKSLF